MWVPLVLGVIKINIDGSYSVEFNRSGIGGVSHDYFGNITLHFNKDILMDSAIMIEVMAIKEGLFIAAASQWAPLNTFHIESDSTNVAYWFQN